MHFIRIPGNNLAKRPMRTFLTCLGVALGVASFIALTGLSRGVEKAWTTGLDEKGVHILGMRKGAVEILTATLDENLAGQISGVEGVRAVSGELIDLIQVDNGATVLLSGWPAESSLWKTLHVARGNLGRSMDTGSVVLGESIAAALNKDIGDTVSLHAHGFTVKAIHKSTGTLNNNTIIMALSRMQKLTGKTGQVTVFNIRLATTGDRAFSAKVLSDLNRRFETLLFQETREIADNNKILQLFRAIAWGTSIIALMICAFVVLNTLLMSVTERKREIGIYSALGWKPSRIMMMIGMEAVIITSAGGVTGILSGAFGLEWLIRGTELNAYIDPRLDVWIVMETFLVSAVLGTLASIYPAWRAVRISPTEALRYE
ncbi:MAG: FtsX-like permease family protein [Deltaproteobacteria bacterium]|nr:FtsX-like permease family protein [Deltaproteobacteria bacterium]